ncbi:short-chain dehydrogenase/reductase [Paenibacillus nasutitermitis]|uniref:Short-chain dehydrogenase/reductase n=2 Tax=Paenibacillus nasutitermitis TaxID=1652958 RepID=A0A917E2H7_9BACL|nr:short-chain dehydrogenase/reductase [Paenibacillus nasutitermitis]
MRDISRSKELLEAAEAAACDRLVVCKELDITQYDQITAVVRECEAEFGSIDVLVNNAGYALGGFAEDVSIEKWSALLRTNVLGAIAMTQAVLPSMRSRRRGIIINVSSISGLMGMPGFAPYVSSKFALEGFSESLRHELYPWGIRVALVEPGAYGTDIWRKGLSNMAGDGSSAYASQLAQILEKTKKTAEHAADPRDVASAIVSIVRQGAPRLRYPLGRGIRMTLLIRAILPWRIYETIVQWAIRRKP